MAYWYINFTSFNNVSYQIRIYGKSGSTNDGLIGGAHPIVTEEDDSNDVYTPVRLQTGYINIVDTGKTTSGATFNWRSLIPATVTARPVALYRNQTTVAWMGFIRQEMYSGTFMDLPQERSYPIQCALGVMESLDLAVEAGTYYNIASLLTIILQINSWEYLYFQGADAVSTLNSGWLYKKLSSEILLTPSDTENGNYHYQYNCLAMLREICKFFGWSARSCGQSLYFCAATDSVQMNEGFTRITEQDLDNIASGTGAVQYGIVDWNQVYLTIGDYKSNNLTQIYMPGYRKVTVTQDVALRGAVMDVEDEVFNKEMDMYLSTSYTAANGGIDVNTTYLPMVWYTQRALLSTQDATMIAQDHYVKRYNLSNAYLDIHFAPTHSPSSYCYPERFDKQDENENKTNFNWISGIYVQRNLFFVNDESTYVKTIIKSKHPYTLNNGVLVISGGCRTDVRANNKTYNAHGRLTCRLRVGNKYFYGYQSGQPQWVTNSSADFQFDTGGSTWDVGTGSINSNRTLRSSLPSYDGYGISIPASTHLSGVIELEILNYFTMGAAYDWALLTDLSLTFYRNTESQFSEKENNTYEATANSALQDEYTVENIFTIDENNGLGAAILINPDNSYCQDLIYTGDGGGAQEVPGQHNASVIANFTNKPREILDIEVNDPGLSTYNPATLVFDNVQEEMHWPMSISRDWRDSTTKIKMINMD